MAGDVRLEIRIDSITHSIDSINPEILGPWMVEIFARAVPINPATFIQCLAWPSYNPDGKWDWITDGHYNRRVYQPMTPRELVDGLAKVLDEMEEKQLH